MHAQWANLNTGIADDLNDIYFHANDLHGVVAGNKGIYLTKTGGQDVAAWSRFLPSNSADAALYNRCRFEKITTDLNYKTYICGYDTVNKRAVILTVNLADHSSAFLYQGPTNSALYDILYTYDAVYAVGAAGLVVQYKQFSGTLQVFEPVTGKDLRAIAFTRFSNNQVYLGGDSILLSAEIGSNALYNVTAAPVDFRVLSLQTDGQTLYAISSSGFYKAPVQSLAALSPLTLYKNGPLQPTGMFKSGNAQTVYVATKGGLYRKAGDALEYFPSLLGTAIRSGSVAYNSNSIYVAGPGGLVLRSLTAGGGTKPFVNASFFSECKGGSLTLKRDVNGSGNSCRLVIYDSTQNEVENMNTNCALTFSRGNWQRTGSFTAHYIVSNGSFSDTALFSFYVPEPPAVDLATTILDSVLCKSEKTSLQIASTTTGWDYILRKQGTEKRFGQVAGNGATATLLTDAISESGLYYIQVAAQGNGCQKNFTQTLPITVENPQGRLASQYVNAFAGEPVTLTAISPGATRFRWKFDPSASRSAAEGKTAVVSFSTEGKKSVELISWTEAGCYDTAQLAVTRVVSESTLPATCYGLNVSGEDASYNGSTPLPLQEDLKLVEDGYLVGGSAYRYSLRSAAGDSIHPTDFGGLYLAKYSAKGMLKWRWYSNYPDYNCPTCYYRDKSSVKGVEVLSDGRLVFAGNEHAGSWFYVGNGDSVRLTQEGTGTGLHGFIAQTSGDGAMQWRGVFLNAPVLKMKRDRLGNYWVLCTRGNQFSYIRNGITAVTLTNTAAVDKGYLLVKLTSNGEFVAATKMDMAGGNFFGEPRGLVLDSKGNAWVTGEFETSATFYNSNHTPAATASRQVSSVSHSMFLVKYSSNADYQFHVNGAMLRTNATSYHDTRADRIAVDSLDYIYVLGKAAGRDTNSVLSLVHSNGTAHTETLGGMFLARFNNQGVVQWVNGTRYLDYASDGHAIVVSDSTITVSSTLWTNNSQPWTGRLTSTDGNQYGFPINYSSFFLAAYNYGGVLQNLATSETGTGGYIYPNNITRKNGQYLVSGELSRYNGGGSQFSLFGIELPAQGSDGFFVSLADGFCYGRDIPVADAGPDQTTCSGVAVTLGSAALPRHYYSWTSSPAGFVSSDANPVVTPQTSTTYYLAVVNSSGHIAYDTVRVSITGAVANAGPDRQLCAGESVRLGAPAVPGVNYSWTAQPTGFRSDSAMVSVSPTVTTTYYLVADAGTGCSGSDSVVVTVVSVPVADAGPDQEVCHRSGAVIGTNEVPGNLYTWSPATGLTATIGAQPSAIPPVTTTYTLTVVNAAGCRATDSVTVAVISVPKPVITASGPLSICEGASVELYSSSPTGNEWFRNGARLPEGTGARYTATQPGYYTVWYTDGRCYSPFADSTHVIVNPIPQIPRVVSSNGTEFCSGVNTVLTSSAPAGNQWYRDTQPVSGATGQQYTATLPGAYAVRVTLNGCSSNLSAVTELRDGMAPPVPVLQLAGSPVICAGGQALISSADTGQHRWFRDGILLPGAEENSLLVTKTGQYSARLIRNGCVSGPSQAISVQAMDTLFIRKEGNTLVSSAATGNQWYVNGSLIPGANGNSIIPTVSGVYHVIVITAGCPPLHSNGLEFVFNTTLNIGPNPVTDLLTIQDVNPSAPLQLSLSDLYGKVLKQVSFTGRYQLDMRHFSPGLYVLQIKNTATGSHEERMIVKF